MKRIGGRPTAGGLQALRDETTRASVPVRALAAETLKLEAPSATSSPKPAA